jgi:hypothetical protein
MAAKGKKEGKKEGKVDFTSVTPYRVAERSYHAPVHRCKTILPGTT